MHVRYEMTEMNADVGAAICGDGNDVYCMHA